jgi:fatty acid desaturase
LREVREGRDGPEDLLRPSDEARLIQPRGRPDGRTLPNDYQLARTVIAAELGRARIAELHRPFPLLDWLVIVALPSAFVGLALALGRLPLGLPWLACLVAQGFLIQALAYSVHDLFVHRRVGGKRAGYVIGVLFELPILARRTWYALYHLDHHDQMNTDVDPEEYKQDLDTRWKKVACLTLPGLFLLFARKLRSPHDPSMKIEMGPTKAPTDATLVRQLRQERLVAVGGLAVLGLATYVSWPLVVFGYVLPFVIVTPIASMCRLVLEHAESDPTNVFSCGTFYRTGLVSGPLFFWDAGDCHVVHHMYPAIPFYRMRRAVRLMRPVLVRHGARERRSFSGLLYGFFVRNERHRTLWSR